MFPNSATKFGVVAAISAALVLAGFIGWKYARRDIDQPEVDAAATPDLITRGAYLARAADCITCHTTADGTPYAGGVEFKLPFGKIYSTNITPDVTTGIGSWSDNHFVRALHQGVDNKGNNLYPAFPYTSFTKMTREDAVAIKAYLFSLPAVDAPAKQNELAFPFNQRWSLWLWNFLFLDARRYHNDERLTAEQNRGAYLATALGHCGECHTPRNVTFALDSGRTYLGATVNGWHAPNITSDRSKGIGGWSTDELEEYFRTGHAEGKGTAAGPMAEVIENSLRFLKNSDADALVNYLEPTHAVAASGEHASSARVTALRKSDIPDRPTLGSDLFESLCTGCHLINGRGRQSRFADLLGSSSTKDPEGTNVIQILLHGANFKILDSSIGMPGFGQSLSDAEIASLTNYVLEHFGEGAGTVQEGDVSKARSQ